MAHRTRIPVMVLCALVASAIGALTVTGGAGAATPCAKAIVADWYDNGRIDRIYALPCYQQAIDAVPSEIRDYTNAEEIISRAFQVAFGRSLGTRTPQSVNPSPAPGPGPIVSSSSPGAIPIPLLVLAGLSLTLLAGGLGYVSRRRREDDPDGPDVP